MHTSSGVFNLYRPHPPPRPRNREDDQVREVPPENGPYGQVVGVSLDVRRRRFAALVKRVLADGGDRGLTIPDIEKATGVSKSTFYRWRDGDWTRDPSGSHVRNFFDGLGVPYRLAYNALDWADPEAGTPDPEPELPPEVREILRKLRDPATSEQEKQFLRESLRMLAGRGGHSSGRRQQAG